MYEQKKKVRKNIIKKLNGPLVQMGLMKRRKIMMREVLLHLFDGKIKG